MQGFLNDNKIEYVLTHLGHHLEIDSSIKNCFVYSRAEQPPKVTGKIIFPLSEASFSLESVRERKGIPVLFPLIDQDDFYHFENENLVFHDDLLKSAFYFLSGFQELNPAYLDHLDRFPYELSVQKQLDICHIPVVNYYFEVIMRGIREFCELHNLPYAAKELFKPAALFLTHDVDRVDTYTLPEVIFRFKQAIGLSKKSLSWSKSWKLFFHYLFNFLKFYRRRNPNWDFPYHLEMDRKFNFTSTYFFLSKGIKNRDAYYSFSEPRIISLMKELNEAGCEIGLHGTLNTAADAQLLKKEKAALEKYSGVKVFGNRQHTLRFNMEHTPLNYSEAELEYDATLGFAVHEGFRNGYCHPFYLYDHANDRMLPTIEIPLNVMDATLFFYRKLNIETALNQMDKLLGEVVKFGGVFSLLWHNGYFDELHYPGIRKFYEELLLRISALQPESLTGKKIIDRLRHI